MKLNITNGLLCATLITPAALSTQSSASDFTESAPSELKRHKMIKTDIPLAQPKTTIKTYHQGKFTVRDDFAWLRDADWKQSKDGAKNPEIMDYLKKEEAYTDAFLSPLKPVIEEYVKLRLSMIAEIEDSYPVLEHGFYYFTRISNKTQYPIHFRFAQGQTPEDAVAYFDENEESKGHEFFNVDSLDISPDNRLLAYTIDLEGHESFTLRIRNLETGVELTDVLKEVDGTIVWLPDSKGFYYVVRNENDRPTYVYFHALGQTQADDVLVYEEPDETVHMGIGTSADEKYLLVYSSTNDESGVQGLAFSASPDHKLSTLVERKPKRKVGIDHKDGFFYIHTNDKGNNFRLAKVPATQIMNEAAWQEILPTSKNRFIVGFQALAKGIAVETQYHGLNEIGLLDEANQTLRLIPMAEKSYTADLMSMPYDAEFLRFSYSSLSKPHSTIEADFDTLQTTVRKVRAIPSGHNPDDYVTDRIFFEARDGVQVPVSLIYKKGKYRQDGTGPLCLEAYGSYGIPFSAEFSTWLLPLLDKGFIYAIAHVRGGTDMGYDWYLDGKMENKDNTFNDFIDVARGLIAEKYTSMGNINATGGSAGGLLMGAVANKAPELFGSIVSKVPFVDVLNTMLDGSLPLTPGEYQEWGNPATDEDVFKRLLSYSPYDNLQPGLNYPAMYVTGGLYDSRVTYWEMLKYIAKLRQVSPETPAWLRMKTAGHHGGTALEDQLRETGEAVAFTLKMHGLI